MLAESLASVPTGTPGVYCLYDLDGTPAYAGQSSQLRSRLRQHFIRQDSSVVSYGRLDIWDISRFEWWETDDRDAAEQALLSHHSPYLNFGTGSDELASNPPIDLSDPDGEVRLISTEEETFRAEPYTRTKQKLEHLSRMVDKIKLAGHSDDTKRTLYEHHRILMASVAEFLELENPHQSDLEEWSDS